MEFKAGDIITALDGSGSLKIIEETSSHYIVTVIKNKGIVKLGETFPVNKDNSILEEFILDENEPKLPEWF